MSILPTKLDNVNANYSVNLIQTSDTFTKFHFTS